jgi:hypothetical protein
MFARINCGMFTRINCGMFARINCGMFARINCGMFTRINGRVFTIIIMIVVIGAIAINIGADTEVCPYGIVGADLRVRTNPNRNVIPGINDDRMKMYSPNSISLNLFGSSKCHFSII